MPAFAAALMRSGLAATEFCFTTSPAPILKGRPLATSGPNGLSRDSGPIAPRSASVSLSIGTACRLRSKCLTETVGIPHLKRWWQ